MSLRAYATRRGVSAEAVSKAITAGRLRESVTMVDGDPKIADPELADVEWGENTRPRVDRPKPSRSARGASRESDTDGDAGDASDGDIPDYFESRARREAAQAALAELELGKRRGELVSVAEARADVIDRFTIVKTRIMGVPARLAQRLPRIAADVVPLLDDLLREALEELATGEVSSGADDDKDPDDDRDGDTDV